MISPKMPASKVFALLDTMTPDQRDGALQMLDLISRPLTTRDLEEAMRARGVNRNAAHRLANLVKHLHVVALATPPETSQAKEGT